MPRDPDRRQTLIKAAEHLFVTHGYDAVTVDTLCKQTQSSKGSFYHFFTSKEDLAINMVNEVWHRTQARMTETFAPHVTPLDAITNELQHTYALRSDSRQLTGCPIGSLSGSMGRHEKIRRRLNFALNHMRQFYATAFIHAVNNGSLSEKADPEALADLMLATVQGIGVVARSTNSITRVRQMADHVLTLLAQMKEFD